MQYHSLVTATDLSFVLLAVFCLSAAMLAAAPVPSIHWHPTDTGLPTNVEPLAPTPLSPTVLYAGTWGEGVYRSTDHGAACQLQLGITEVRIGGVSGTLYGQRIIQRQKD